MQRNILASSMIVVLLIFTGSHRSVSGGEDTLPRHSLVFVHHSDAARQDYDIWRICPDGTQMASVVVLPGHQAQFSISPDGKELVYTSKVNEKSDIWRRAFDGGKAENITNHPSSDTAPSWSPDGKEIAFFSDRDSEKPELYILHVESGTVRRMTNNPFHESGASWSPDGTKIVLTRYFPRSEEYDGNGEMFEINLETGTEKQLTALGGYNGGADHSPDGRQIAFHRVANGTSEIWLMKADGSEQRQVTDTFIDEYSPAWSPDGTWIAFTAGTEHDGRGTFDLWIMRPDGTDRWVLHTAPNTQMEPRWRPGEFYCR